MISNRVSLPQNYWIFVFLLPVGIVLNISLFVEFSGVITDNRRYIDVLSFFLIIFLIMCFVYLYNSIKRQRVEFWKRRQLEFILTGFLEEIVDQDPSRKKGFLKKFVQTIMQEPVGCEEYLRLLKYPLQKMVYEYSCSEISKKKEILAKGWDEPTEKGKSAFISFEQYKNFTEDIRKLEKICSYCSKKCR